MCMSFSRKRFLREKERGRRGRKEKDKGVPMVNFLYISIRIENVDSLESRNLKNIEIVVLLKKIWQNYFFKTIYFSILSISFLVSQAKFCHRNKILLSPVAKNIKN